VPSLTVKKEQNTMMHYITLTVKNWYYIFDRHNRWDILLESLCYCQEKKGLKVYAYVFMMNHIHLIIQSPDVSGFLRDFKKHTAHEIMKNITATEPSVAKLFLDEDGKYSIWQKTNMPIPLESFSVFAQKKTYIENNPVRKKYVQQPEHWIYSSASLGNFIKIHNITDEQ
jgi:putative transposase